MKPEAKKTNDYESNPFRLAIDATRRLFNTNRGWAIFLFVLGLLGLLSSKDSPTNQAHTTQDSMTAATTGSGNTLALIVFIVSIVAIAFIGIMVIGAYVQGILSYVALQSEKGKKVSVSEAYGAVSLRFWRLFGAQLLAFVKILGWSLLLIVPGIITGFRYALLGYVIMDEPSENRSVKESHERVKSITKSRLWEVAGLSMTAIVPALGSLFDTAGKAAQYNQLKYYHDKKLEKPAVHWLNYMLVLLFAALIVAIVVLLVLAFFRAQTA